MRRKGEKSMNAPMAEYQDYLNIVSPEDFDDDSLNDDREFEYDESQWLQSQEDNFGGV